MEAIKVLIADDNEIDRMVLSRVIRNQGNTVLEAKNGTEAVAVYLEHKPDIILMDVMMPGLSGKEATLKIKAIAGDDFVPVIFLTSLTDAQSLADCLECGGDDFLSKPYNHIILQAKINSFHRMCEMHRTLRNQRDTIAKSNEHMLQEQHVAKAVYDNVAHAGCLNAPNIRYMLSPLAVFNGDVVLAARKPDGGMHVLLGDFTGHGLPAAIGAMPLAEIFYGMTAKGFALADVMREMNLKLKGILPVGFFCCAAGVDLAVDRQSVSVWMGGIPDCYLLRADGKTVETLSSTHLPLGVLSNEKFSDSMTCLPMTDSDRLFLWSDGIIESRNSVGELFGLDALRAIFDDVDQPSAVFDEILSRVTRYVGDAERDDDTTLLELRMVDDTLPEEVDVAQTAGPVAGPIDWQMNYELGPQSLRHFNPVPLMNHVMMEVPGLRAMGGQLYTVMAELFSNAFEHGVLGLSSTLKGSAGGFMEYYRLREQRLNELDEGNIRIEMLHKGNGRTGTLILRLIDSGDGFDYRAMNAELLDNQSGIYSGRGIPLLGKICESLQFQGSGNIVEAVIQWPQNQSAS